MDKNELERGDFFPQVLENAIANASLHIAIFFKNYVKSPWCLAELASMLQTHARFIPIFYHIEPLNLRWGFKERGIYANDFYEHEKKNRYSTEMLDTWKSALHNASFYNGEIINNQCDEEKALMNVVNHVLKELKTMRLDVTQHPVGLDEAEQDFDNIALQSKGPIQIIGIWGMGGAGKTTLAKHLYNKKCSLFQNSCFLLDVREAAFKGRLHKKQKKLLQDLKGETPNFDNIDEGKAILRNCLEFVSVLIVLDDVNHKDQFDALLPARDNLGHGSLIIVTTRELDVLRAWDMSAIYKIRTLDPSSAEELFCWHAFGQPSPMIDFKELAKQFIDNCCGLPLSLKVLGGLLHGKKTKEYWESQLDKLSRIVPDDIKSKLKISYDTLDDEEKEMFLDVACFFIGWPSNSTIEVWDGSEWSGLHGWEKLVNKCLVELDKDKNNIRMHDHLRDLGREIANKQSPYRLWSRRQIIEIQPQQEAVRMRGMAEAFGDNCYPRDANIILNTTQGDRILAPGLLGLKIFIGEGYFINEECSPLSRELLCFRCVRFPHKNLPSWLLLKKLRILELVKPEKLEDLWECDEHAPLQLRQLLIRHAYGLKKISGLQRLRSLETLLIEDCTELNTFPGLAELTSLKRIDLSGCSKLENIESLEGLRSLETLKICDCTSLNTLPSLAELTSLKEIDLKQCNKLEKIESLEGLRSLETLKIHYCTELNTLPSLAKLTSLKEIDLSDCNKLEKIESLEGLRSLETLKIRYCTELDILPSLAELTSLEEFTLSRCEKVEKVEGLEVLRSLKKVEVKKCSMRPCMLKLPEQSERLERVEVVAPRVVVEPSIQKWAREEIISTRAVIDVMSLRNFFTSLVHEDVVQPYSSEYLHDGSWGGVRLTMPESAGNGDANAILICFIIHSIHPTLSFRISTDRGNYFSIFLRQEYSSRMGASPEESIWVWMGIFPQQSNWLHSEEYTIEAWGEVKEGWLLRGTGHNIREAFSELSQRGGWTGMVNCLAAHRMVKKLITPVIKKCLKAGFMQTRLQHTHLFKLMILGLHRPLQK